MFCLFSIIGLQLTMKKLSKPLSIIILGISFLPLLLNSLVYPGFFKARIGIPSFFIVFICLLAFIGLQKIYKNKYPNIFYLSLFAFWLGMSVFFIMHYLENTQYKNFVFSKTHIHPQSFVWLPLLSGLFSVLIIPTKILKKHLKTIIFFLPLAIIALLLSIRFAHPNIHQIVIKEDSIVEYLTVFSSLAVSYFGAVILFKRQKIKKDKYLPFFLKTFCVIAIIFGIFIAGEEISWGQRIFDIETPDTLKEINNQNETTIHNVEGTVDIFRFFTLVAGIHGAGSWILIVLLRKTKILPDKLINTFNLWVPPFYTTLWFWLTPYIFKYGYGGLTRFSESVEMLMLTGYGITWARNYSQILFDNRQILN